MRGLREQEEARQGFSPRASRTSQPAHTLAFASFWTSDLNTVR